MPATASIPSATRCRSSDGAEGRVRVRSAVRGLALAVPLLLAACVTTTTRAYLPDASRDRLSLNEAEDALDQLLGVECPRLTAAKHETDDSRISVSLDASGNVLKSTLTKGTGDGRVDSMFGGVTAQMKFDAPADGKPHTGHMRVGYSCGPTTAAVTIQLL